MPAATIFCLGRAFQNLSGNTGHLLSFCWESLTNPIKAAGYRIRIRRLQGHSVLAWITRWFVAWHFEVKSMLFTRVFSAAGRTMCDFPPASCSDFELFGHPALA